MLGKRGHKCWGDTLHSVIHFSFRVWVHVFDPCSENISFYLQNTKFNLIVLMHYFDNLSWNTATIFFTISIFLYFYYSLQNFHQGEIITLKCANTVVFYKHTFTFQFKKLMLVYISFISLFIQKFYKLEQYLCCYLRCMLFYYILVRR
jgi:hypothetical protein